MSTRSHSSHHGDCGGFVLATDLPNTGGGSVSVAALEAGDRAYVTSEGKMYVCTDPTDGSAVWEAVSSGLSGLVQFLNGSVGQYVQAAVPAEEVFGQFIIDTSNIPFGASIKIHASVNPTFGVAGDMYVKAYDLGPVGVPAAPVEITGGPSWELTTSTDGQQYLVTDSFVVGSGVGYPGVGQLSNSGLRLYEVTVIQDSQEDDVVDVGFVGARLEV